MIVSFADLWKNHPANASPAVIQPCRARDGSPGFDNQCVIRLGETLVASGASLASFGGAFCWHGHGKHHPLRVEEFMVWLDSKKVNFLPTKAKKFKKDRKGNQVDYNSFLKQTGIVAFKNFWGRGNNGDHIDLWDGSVVAHGDRDYFQRSEEIWFWAVP